MKFKDVITEAISRKQALPKICSEAKQLLLHLIKLLYFIDNIDLEHYSREINGFYKKVYVVYDSSKTKIKRDILEQVLKGRYKNVDDMGNDIIPYKVEDLIDNELSGYKSLRVRMSVDELKEHLNALYNVILDSIVSGNHINVAQRALEILKNYKERE